MWPAVRAYIKECMCACMCKSKDNDYLAITEVIKISADRYRRRRQREQSHKAHKGYTGETRAVVTQKQTSCLSDWVTLRTTHIMSKCHQMSAGVSKPLSC